MINHIRKHKIRYLLIVIIPMLGILMVFSAKTLLLSSKQIRYMSAVSWLKTAILEELNRYYGGQGKYPQTLHDLNIPFPGDNANPDMLKLFAYTTDGNSFRLVLETNPKEKYRYEYIGTRGKTVRFNEYVGDRLVKSTDYNDLSIYEIKF